MDVKNDGSGSLHMEFKIPTRGVIGFRSLFLRATRGNGVLNTKFLRYEPLGPDIRSSRMGVFVASESGVAVTYGLNNAQERGMTMVEPGTMVYEGMVVGFHQREADIAVNVCKEKKMTNVRSSTSDIAVRLTPAVKYSLEEFLDFIADDELLEVTPQSLRVRKKILDNGMRLKQEKSLARAQMG